MSGRILVRRCKHCNTELPRPSPSRLDYCSFECKRIAQAEKATKRAMLRHRYWMPPYPYLGPEIKFAAVPGNRGYALSSDGRIWSCLKKGPRSDLFYDHWSEIKAGPNATGYPTIAIRGKMFRISRLMLQTFIGDRDKSFEARHFPDRDVSNNSITNLHWGTTQENADDRKFHGTVRLGETVGTSKLTETEVIEIRKLFADGMHPKQIAPRFGILYETVRQIVQRRTWKHIQ